jgi:hypothetical protein
MVNEKHRVFWPWPKLLCWLQWAIPLDEKVDLRGYTLITLDTKFWLFIRLRILLSTVFSKLPLSTIKMAAKRLVRGVIFGVVMAVRAINWRYLL